MAHALKPKPWRTADIKVWYSDDGDAPMDAPFGQYYAVGTEMKLTFKVRLGNKEEPEAQEVFDNFNVEPELPPNVYLDEDTGAITGATTAPCAVQRYTVYGISPLWVKTAEVTMGFGCLPTRPKQPTIRQGRFRGEVVIDWQHISADLRHVPDENSVADTDPLPIEHYAVFLREVHDGINVTKGSHWMSIDTIGTGIAQHPSVRCTIKVEDVMDATSEVHTNCSIRVRGLTPRKIYQARLERRNILGWSAPSKPSRHHGEDYPSCEVPADTFKS